MNFLPQTISCDASTPNDFQSLSLKIYISLIFFQRLLTLILSSTFSKTANLFEILTVNSVALSFLKTNVCKLNFCVGRLLRLMTFLLSMLRSIEFCVNCSKSRGFNSKLAGTLQSPAISALTLGPIQSRTRYITYSTMCLVFWREAITPWMLSYSQFCLTLKSRMPRFYFLDIYITL